MGKINLARVILGGLFAGLIINIGEYVLNELILGEQWTAAIESMNMTPPGGRATAIFILMGFLFGIVTVWLYAAIRPRFGPGPKTAICAGLFAWFFAYLYVNVGFMVMESFPTNLMLIGTVWGLFELPIATTAGAWLYKEESVSA